MSIHEVGRFTLQLNGTPTVEVTDKKTNETYTFNIKDINTEFVQKNLNKKLTSEELLDLKNVVNKTIDSKENKTSFLFFKIHKIKDSDEIFKSIGSELNQRIPKDLFVKDLKIYQSLLRKRSQEYEHSQIIATREELDNKLDEAFKEYPPRLRAAVVQLPHEKIKEIHLQLKSHSLSLENLKLLSTSLSDEEIEDKHRLLNLSQEPLFDLILLSPQEIRSSVVQALSNQNPELESVLKQMNLNQLEIFSQALTLMQSQKGEVTPERKLALANGIKEGKTLEEVRPQKKKGVQFNAIETPGKPHQDTPVNKTVHVIEQRFRNGLAESLQLNEEKETTTAENFLYHELTEAFDLILRDLVDQVKQGTLKPEDVQPTLQAKLRAKLPGTSTRALNRFFEHQMDKKRGKEATKEELRAEFDRGALWLFSDVWHNDALLAAQQTQAGARMQNLFRE